MARTALLLVLFAIAPSAIGCGHGPSSGKQQTEPIAALTKVTVTKPQRKPLVLMTTQPGQIEAFEETPLFAKTAGYVGEVLVDIGDTVKKDQILIVLSIPELINDVDQKQALVAQAEAELKQAKAATTAGGAAAETAQHRIKEMEAGATRVAAEHDRWKSEHKRIQELAGKGSVTKKLEEETFSQLRAAEAAVAEVSAKAQSARATWYEAQANVSKLKADEGAAEARLRVAKADLDRANTMSAYSKIKAPFDGTITRRDVDTGHFVQPVNGANSKPLMVVARTEKIRIFVDVPELEAPQLDAGDPAKVSVQALGVPPIETSVTRTSWSLRESNRSIRAEIDMPNPDGKLRPGMYATVTIQLAARDQAVVVPATAIVRDAGGTACLAVKSGVIVRLPVELGLRSGNEVEVLSGIEEGQLIAVKPDGLKAGQSVEVANPT